MPAPTLIRLLPLLVLVACKGDGTFKDGELTQYLGQAPLSGPYVPRLAGCELSFGDTDAITYKWDGQGRLVEVGSGGTRNTWKYNEACTAALVVENGTGAWKGTCGDEGWPKLRDFDESDCDSEFSYTWGKDGPSQITETTCDGEITVGLGWDKDRVIRREFDTIELDFDYDKHGNMIVETVYDPDAAIETDVTVWEYDKDDRPTSWNVVVRDGAEVDEDPIELSYDGEGVVPSASGDVVITGSCPEG